MATILVVDDSAVDRSLVGGLLEKTTVCTVRYAASGLEALARIKDLVPDLIITDLTMPGMDGLELVKAIRAHYPDVPVILMTAYGNELLAIEALAQGAASYVPKSQLAHRLATTAWQVYSRAQSDRSSRHLLGCLTRSEFTFVLENDARLIDPLIDLVQQMLAATKLCDFAERLQVGIALREALLNALFHGNLELSTEEMAEFEDQLIQEKDQSLVEKRRSEPPYCTRRVFVDIKIGGDEAQFTVRDEGRGFDVGKIPPPNDPAALEGDAGRGLVLMQSFLDELRFSDSGNEVTLVKRRHARS
jgi:CheY-like chemotaxis protein